MTASTNPEAVVIGGGPAGSAAAIELARGGGNVVVLERSLTAHDKVCGDFLSGEALEDMAHLGIRPEQLSTLSIRRVCLAGSLGQSKSLLPFTAASITRRTLDEALLRRAAACGAAVRRGHAVQSLHRVGTGWDIEVASREHSYTLHAKHVVLATGKHDLRGLPRPAGNHCGLVGLKMYLRLAPAQAAELEGAIELLLLDRGYGGLSLVEEGTANLCFLVDRIAMRSSRRDWRNIVAKLTENRHLRMRLQGSAPLLDQPLAINPIPYGYVRHEAIARGLWCVGDQAAVIPSFTGDGVSLALHSGRLAARMLLASGDAEEFQVAFSEQVRRQVGRATTLSLAMTTEPERSLVEAVARLWPGTLGWAAAATRLRPKCRIPERESSCAAA